MSENTKKSSAIEIIGNPNATEELWLEACSSIEPERNFKVALRGETAGLFGWIGALIDSLLTAGFSCMFLCFPIYGLGSLFYQFLDIHDSCCTTAFIFTFFSFVFSFIYGMWIAKYNGGRIWHNSFAVILVLVFNGCMHHVFGDSVPWINALYILFAAIPAVIIGENFFQSLKRSMSPWRPVGMYQLCIPVLLCASMCLLHSWIMVPLFLLMMAGAGVLSCIDQKRLKVVTAIGTAITGVTPYLLASVAGFLVQIIHHLISGEIFSGHFGCFLLFPIIFITLASTSIIGGLSLWCMQKMQGKDDQESTKNNAVLNVKYEFTKNGVVVVTETSPAKCILAKTGDSEEVVSTNSGTESEGCVIRVPVINTKRLFVVPEGDEGEKPLNSGSL